MLKFPQFVVSYHYKSLEWERKMMKKNAPKTEPIMVDYPKLGFNEN